MEDDRLYPGGRQAEGREQIARPAVVLEVGVPFFVVSLEEAGVHEDGVPFIGHKDPGEIREPDLVADMGEVEKKRCVTLAPALAQGVDLIGGPGGHLRVPPKRIKCMFSLLLIISDRYFGTIPPCPARPSM